MVILTRSQIRRAGILKPKLETSIDKNGSIISPAVVDVTVKSGPSWLSGIRPTYTMVMGHKYGGWTDQRYIDEYTKRLRSVKPDVWMILYRIGRVDGNGRLELECYCIDGKFCHTHLLIDYIVERFPDHFSDGREWRWEKDKGF